MSQQPCWRVQRQCEAPPCRDSCRPASAAPAYRIWSFRTRCNSRKAVAGNRLRDASCNPFTAALRQLSEGLPALRGRGLSLHGPCLLASRGPQTPSRQGRARWPTGSRRQPCCSECSLRPSVCVGGEGSALQGGCSLTEPASLKGVRPSPPPPLLLPTHPSSPLSGLSPFPGPSPYLPICGEQIGRSNFADHEHCPVLVGNTFYRFALISWIYTIYARHLGWPGFRYLIIQTSIIQKVDSNLSLDIFLCLDWIMSKLNIPI